MRCRDVRFGRLAHQRANQAAWDDMFVDDNRAQYGETLRVCEVDKLAQDYIEEKAKRDAELHQQWLAMERAELEARRARATAQKRR